MRAIKIYPRNLGHLKEMVEECVKTNGCIVCSDTYECNRITELVKQLELNNTSVIIVKEDKEK